MRKKITRNEKQNHKKIENSIIAKKTTNTHTENM